MIQVERFNILGCVRICLFVGTACVTSGLVTSELAVTQAGLVAAYNKACRRDAEHFNMFRLARETCRITLDKSKGGLIITIL